MSKKKNSNSQPLRSATNQPGVYRNTRTGKYDVKYCYTITDPATAKKEHKSKWIYGINSYNMAVNTLAKMKRYRGMEKNEDITLEEAFEL